MINKIISAFKESEVVEALVLGGSRATGVFDSESDYDFYVYLRMPFSEKDRRSILDEYVKYMEYSNHFWELEDDGVLKDGTEVEFIYRSLDSLEESLENLLVKMNTTNAYTTCFVDNLVKSKVLFDKTGRLTKMKNKYSKLLTPTMFDTIISDNFPILMDRVPSLYYQVEKAMKRRDLVSINHRSSAFLEIYFNIIFSLNRVTHPGEKRMLEIASKLDELPHKFEENIQKYFNYLYVDNQKALKILKEITINLYNLLREKGYELSLDSYRKKR